MAEDTGDDDDDNHSNHKGNVCVAVIMAEQCDS